MLVVERHKHKGPTPSFAAPLIDVATDQFGLKQLRVDYMSGCESESCPRRKKWRQARHHHLRKEHQLRRFALIAVCIEQNHLPSSFQELINEHIVAGFLLLNKRALLIIFLLQPIAGAHIR